MRATRVVDETRASWTAMGHRVAVGTVRVTMEEQNLEFLDPQIGATRIIAETIALSIAVKQDVAVMILRRGKKYQNLEFLDPSLRAITSEDGEREVRYHNMIVNGPGWLRQLFEALVRGTPSASTIARGPGTS